jgi:hypothetical protein
VTEKRKKNKTRRCRPFIKKLNRNSDSNKSSNKSTSAPKMFRYAKFYNIADKVELSIDDEDVSRKERRNKFDNNIINELNSNSKYQTGDILFIGDVNYPFAIVDEKNQNINFTIREHPEELPFGRMLNKVKEHKVKYQKIFENVNELGEFRELFVGDNEEEIINDYKDAGIY